MADSTVTAPTIKIEARRGAAEAEILTPQALDFLGALAVNFEAERQKLLEARIVRAEALRQGQLYDFLPETASVRAGDWRVAPIPPDIQDRRTEITGPVDRKMVINALNAGASVYMADFEDSTAPTWRNVIDGQLNLRDAIRREISFTGPEGKQYRLNEKTAVLFVRPRGWHLPEKHLLVQGQPISASLFDFGLYFFHNAAELKARGTGPYFYLPKMESHREARLWNSVFNFAQDALGVPRGTIRATVLIETLPGAFEMDEILFELKDHSAGLNCGRWDYIFSFIKKFSYREDLVLPDRSTITMDRHFLKSYVELLIETCHRRGIHAMGGMAAQIPIKGDPAANDAAMERVRQDKLREAKAGHDGTWVAHPGLVPVAKAVFDEYMPGPNQIERRKPGIQIKAADLVAIPEGDITRKGLEMNIDIGLRYLAAWLDGLGCVPIYNLMEDAATAEISRAQLWQWAHHAGKMTDGVTIDVAVVQATIPVILDRIKQELGEQRFAASKFTAAGKLFEQMTAQKELPDFLTSIAYQSID
ncbi:MAG: malate synthase A [Acidobacteriaceae bacterium]